MHLKRRPVVCLVLGKLRNAKSRIVIQADIRRIARLLSFRGEQRGSQHGRAIPGLVDESDLSYWWPGQPLPIGRIDRSIDRHNAALDRGEWSHFRCEFQQCVPYLFWADRLVGLVFRNYGGEWHRLLKSDTDFASWE